MNANEKKRKIMIVDDEPLNLLVLNETLKDTYDLSLIDGGELAVEEAKKNLPDLILLDVMMPDISGHEVCRQLKADPNTKHIPIIFVSAMSDMKDEAYGFTLGAVDYITKPVRPAIVSARVKTHLSLVRMEELERTQLQIIQSLGYAAEYKDDDTGQHVVRMSHYCRLIAKNAGLSGGRVEEIFRTAPMHDIGKIGIPDGILKKSGKLDENEWKIMKNHPLIGAKIIGDHSEGLLRTARMISLSHHEKWDGTGYPYGLRGKEICIEGRITAIADVFDALTSARPYKRPWSIEEAVAYLRSESGKHFDPELVQIFLSELPSVTEISRKWKETADS